ncbi:MAG: hypothetical protein AB7I50_23335 [Vicinamibacterales bacterium]
MAERKITAGEDFGSSLKGFGDADLERGYADARPRGNYEGSLDPTVVYDVGEDGQLIREEGGTLHPGQIEPDGFFEHPPYHGFVRRPVRRNDVERN